MESSHSYKLRILQVSAADMAGGAEGVAWQLFQGYRCLGHGSWLAVGLKRSADRDVLVIPRSTNIWYRLCMGIATQSKSLAGRVKGAGRFQQFVGNLSRPFSWLQRELGREDFSFPGTWCLLDLAPEKPGIVHCHNLHGPFVPGGGYFDLRALPWLTQQVPVVLTLHDAWLLSGHCAHSFDCERWQTGCGHCPDLTIYPAIRRDATVYNWRRKQEIYAKSRLYVATPSRWLMQKVEQSMLAPAVVEARVIPNGVDLAVFHPADRQAVRAALGMPPDARVLLFAANSIRRNIWKDYQTMRAAVAQVAERLHGQSVLFIALGEDAPAERIGQAEVRFVPFQKDPEAVARYYQAADVYVHAARADTFPTTVLEALACGTPVVATAVGGIPEQVKPLRIANCELNGPHLDEATGVLLPPRDANGMATSITRLLSNEVLRRQLGENAAKDARCRFDLEWQVKAYLDWYQEIIDRRQMERQLANAQ
jgi:glycosyltransferase involved in cell wall biosynthesis